MVYIDILKLRNKSKNYKCANKIFKLAAPFIVDKFTSIFQELIAPNLLLIKLSFLVLLNTSEKVYRNELVEFVTSTERV